ncbi:hypothetical protein [Streptomyces sp. NPDC008317]|uniref:hypothetical protein n=1 Tax=Streptomyces sp. NPDC008317 TaxID=3364827 RepID=UPI0036E0C00D
MESVGARRAGLDARTPAIRPLTIVAAVVRDTPAWRTDPARCGGPRASSRVNIRSRLVGRRTRGEPPLF